MRRQRAAAHRVHVDDRRGLALGARARRRGRPRPARPSISSACVGVGRGGMPAEVGRADRQRPGALEQRERDLVVGHPDRDGAAGVAEVPAAGTAAGGRRGSAGRARTPRRAPRRTAGTSVASASRVVAALISTGGGMSRPRPLASSSALHRVGVEGVGTDAVDGVGRQHDQPPLLHRLGGRLDRRPRARRRPPWCTSCSSSLAIVVAVASSCQPRGQVARATGQVAVVAHLRPTARRR